MKHLGLVTIQNNVPLHTLTTFHIGGPAQELVTTHTEYDFVHAVLEADKAEQPLFVLGGGSNVLVSDQGFEGRVLQDGRTKILDVTHSANESGEKIAFVRAPAGMNWDELVVATIDLGLSGLESLSGIPGTVGAAPVQNVGAYGHEVSEVIDTVRVLDREEGQVHVLSYSSFNPAYRTSDFKRSLAKMRKDDFYQATGRWVVIDVTFKLKQSNQSLPIQYAELAGRLDRAAGESAPVQEVRDIVLVLRASKGMVLIEADHDTWSAGSFFTNPIISEERANALAPDVPRYPSPHGVKVSAAYLIQHAGFAKGSDGNDSLEVSDGTAATLSTKHVLALTNRGHASAQDIVALAQRVKDGVFNAYNIELVPEPVFVGIPNLL